MSDLDFQHLAPAFQAKQPPDRREPICNPLQFLHSVSDIWPALFLRISGLFQCNELCNTGTENNNVCMWTIGMEPIWTPLQPKRLECNVGIRSSKLACLVCRILFAKLSIGMIVCGLAGTTLWCSSRHVVDFMFLTVPGRTRLKMGVTLVPEQQRLRKYCMRRVCRNCPLGTVLLLSVDNTASLQPS